MVFSTLIPVFPLFDHVLHFLSYFWDHILTEYEKLHRSIYPTLWFKIPLLPYMRFRGFKTWSFDVFFWIFDHKTNLESISDNFLNVFLIGKRIWRVTKCITGFLMTLLDGLGMVTENRPPPFHNKSDFSLRKLCFFRF